MNKKIKSTILAFSVLLATSACTDLLTETTDSYYDDLKLFSTLQGAQMALNDVYETLAHPDHYGQNEMAMPTSDDMYYISGTNSDGSRRDISHYQLSTNNAWIKTLWEYKYRGLNRANHVIEKVQLMQEYKDGNTEAKRIEAQARFMRALLAYDIVRYWGDVPFKTTPTSSVSEAYQPRSSREDILNQIEEDLRIAKTNLPWATAGSNPERPTQGAARALLMRVLLFRSGYHLPSTAGVGSALVRPDDTVRQLLFKRITDEYEAFVAHGFHDLSPLGYRGYWKSFGEKRHEPVESLFEIGFFTPDGKNYGAGTWGTYIGPLTDAKSKYGRANAFFLVIPAWYKTYYEATDVRRTVSICNYKINANSDSISADKNHYPGKWRREWMKNPIKDMNNVDVNFVMLRYADVLLMAAEAYNERTDVAEQEKAKTLINDVRRRARATEWTDDASFEALYVTDKLAEVATFIPADDMRGKIRRALYWERGFELCFEGTRKYDLLRWGVLDKAVKATSNGPGYIANSNFTTGKHELFPLPLSEIQVNHQLKYNNPGFN